MSQPQDEIWTTEDGTQIAIGDLTENHAKNILRMIIKQKREKDEFFRKEILPKISGMLEELQGTDGEITFGEIRIDGESISVDDASSIDAMFAKAGAGGNNIH